MAKRKKAGNDNSAPKAPVDLAKLNAEGRAHYEMKIGERFTIGDSGLTVEMLSSSADGSLAVFDVGIPGEPLGRWIERSASNPHHLIIQNSADGIYNNTEPLWPVDELSQPVDARAWLTAELGEISRQAESPDEYEQNRIALEEVRSVKWLLEQLRAVDDSAAAAAKAKYHLGRLTERMRVRPYQPDAKRGKTVSRGTAKSRDKRAAIVKERRDHYANVVRKHLAANSKNTITHARKLAADECGVSIDAILDATRNLRK